MKKNIFVFVLLFQALLVNAQSDSSYFPRPSVEIGTGIQINSYKGSIYDSYSKFRYPVDESFWMYNFIVSVNIPLKQLNEKCYFGLNPNFIIGYSPASIEIGTPVFATLKYGAGSNRDSGSRAGFGFGVGGYVSGFSTRLAPLTYSDYISYSGLFVAPAVMGEFSLNTNYTGPFQIRTDFTPVFFEKIGDYSGTIGQFNLRVVRVF